MILTDGRVAHALGAPCAALRVEELEKELSWVIRSLRQMEANMAEAKARLEEGDFAEEASLPYELVAARGM